MTTPATASRTPYDAWRVIIVAAVAIALAHLGDQWAYRHLAVADVYDHDAGRMFRSIGFLPLWLIAALAFWLQVRDTRRALFLALTPTVGGALCALLQLVIRRERPLLHEGAYYFRPFTDRPFHGAEFGMPSSHATVAFCGAWVLCRLYPRASAVWLLLAAGCALTRVEAQAHFLSDVTAGAIVAWMITQLLARVILDRRGTMRRD